MSSTLSTQVRTTSCSDGRSTLKLTTGRIETPSKSITGASRATRCSPSAACPGDSTLKDEGDASCDVVMTLEPTSTDSTAVLSSRSFLAVSRCARNDCRRGSRSGTECCGERWRRRWRWLVAAVAAVAVVLVLGSEEYTATAEPLLSPRAPHSN